mgnify:CR=1 FL=1
MGEGNATSRGLTIGIDVGDRVSRLCVLGADGEILGRARVATERRAMGEQLRQYPPSLVVIEAGTHSPWLSRLAAEAGHEVLVANPRHLRFIYASLDKSDPVDAESLARVGRLDPRLLRPIQHRSAQHQADRALLRAREALVRTRTLLVNHVRSTLKAFGERVPACASEVFPKRARGVVPGELHEALTPLLALLEDLTRQIRAYDRQIEHWCATKYPETRLLRPVAGVGPVTALTYVLSLEDPARFPSSRSVGSYLGLRPRRDQSGGRDPQLPITKAGDPSLRVLLVQSAQYILGPFGPDSDLRRFGMRLMERGGAAAKKRAIIAVARKLAVLLHRLWRTGEVYDPLRNASRHQSEAA